MKRMTYLVAGFLISTVSGVTAWQLSAQAQHQENHVFTQWQYPGARSGSSSTGSELQAVRYTTSDSIETVWSFYQKKSAPPLDATNTWHPTQERIKLVNQVPATSPTLTYISLQRQKANNALFVIRQTEQTITVQLSREEGETKTTDILIIVDTH